MSIVIRNDSQLFFYLIKLCSGYPYSVRSCLSVFSKEEQCQCSRTRMCSDHRTDIGYRDPVISESLFNNRSKFLCIFYTITMTDKNILIFRMYRQLLHPVCKLCARISRRTVRRMTAAAVNDGSIFRSIYLRISICLFIQRCFLCNMDK